MPKAYWIGRIDVNDPDAYKQYVAANGKAFGNTAQDFWYVAAKRKRAKAAHAHAMS